MPKRILITTAVLTALAFGSTLAHAQEASTPPPILRGLSIGLHGSATALTLSGETRTELGGGLGIAIGYDFSNNLSIRYFSNTSFMAFPDWDYYFLTHRELEGRFTIGSGSHSLAPNLALGVSSRATHFERPRPEISRSAERATLGLMTGAGVRYRLRPTIALDWSLRYEFGNLLMSRGRETVDVIQTPATSGRVGFGVSWYPFK